MDRTKKRACPNSNSPNNKEKGNDTSQATKFPQPLYSIGIFDKLLTLCTTKQQKEHPNATNSESDNFYRTHNCNTRQKSPFSTQYTHPRSTPETKRVPKNTEHRKAENSRLTHETNAADEVKIGLKTRNKNEERHLHGSVQCCATIEGVRKAERERERERGGGWAVLQCVASKGETCPNKLGRQKRVRCALISRITLPPSSFFFFFSPQLFNYCYYY